MTNAPVKSVQVLLIQQRTTKNFVVYHEHVEKLEDEPRAAIFHLPRKAFESMGRPGLITITVEVDD